MIVSRCIFAKLASRQVITDDMDNNFVNNFQAESDIWNIRLDSYYHADINHGWQWRCPRKRTGFDNICAEPFRANGKSHPLHMSSVTIAVAINLRLTGSLKLNPRQKMHNDVKHERALWQHLYFLRVFLLFSMSGMLIAWDVFIFDDRDEKQQLFCIFNFTVVWRSDSILIVAVIMSMFWDITLYSFRRKCRIISLQYH